MKKRPAKSVSSCSGVNPVSLGHPIPTKSLLPYFFITFAITWGIVGFYIIAPDSAVTLLGEISGRHPAFFLATWAPAIAALLVVLAYSGTGGVGAFLSRLALWRCSAAWATFLLVGVPAIFVAGALVKGSPIGIPFSTLKAAGAAMLLMACLGPVEELGWRGVAQPILQRHMAPIWAGALIGSAWGLWHFPAFFLSGTVFSGWSFAPFFIGNVSLAIIVTPLFNASRGSILLPALFHFQLINPLWPDAQPFDTYFFVAAAAVVAWLNRTTMFQKTAAVTSVRAATRQPAATIR